jgi:cell division protein FtsB
MHWLYLFLLHECVDLGSYESSKKKLNINIFLPMKLNVKILISIICLSTLLTLAGLLVFGQRGLFHLLTLQEQFATLEAENQRIVLENEQLKKEIELLHENLAYIEDIARKQLGLAKKDELVYQLQPPENEEPGLDKR